MSALGGDAYARARIRRPDGDYTPPPPPMGYTPRPASDLVTTKPKATCHGEAEGEAGRDNQIPADGRGTAPTTASPAEGAPSAGAPEPSHQPEPPRTVTSDQVLAYLREHPRASATQIAQALRAEVAQVGHRLADLHRRRQAHRVTRGRWTPAPERNRNLATLEQVHQACAGLGRFTAQDIAKKLDAETKTVRNRLADLVAAGHLVRLQRGVYRDAAWQPQAHTDADRHTKQDTIRAILRHATTALSARDIWQQEPQRLGGDDPTRVCAALDALRRRGLAEVVPGTKPQLWFDPAAWPEGPPARHGEAESEAGPDLTTPTAQVAPLPEHQHQVRRLRGLAAQTLLDPIVRGWLNELADDIEQQHQPLEPQA